MEDQTPTGTGEIGAQTAVSLIDELQALVESCLQALEVNADLDQERQQQTVDCTAAANKLLKRTAILKALADKAYAQVASPSDTRIGMFGSIISFHELQCSDPRDRIYSLNQSGQNWHHSSRL